MHNMEIMVRILLAVVHFVHFPLVGGARQEVTPLPTPHIHERPDPCEPNNDRFSACAVALDRVHGPYTFLPDGDIDWYRLVIEHHGLDTVMTVRATKGLDIVVQMSLDDGTELVPLTPATAPITIPAALHGGVVMRMENRSPQRSTGEGYTVEFRSVLPPADPPVERAVVSPDPLENNWSPQTASPIGVGSVYALNFVCPVAWGCSGGDHDYFRLAVKAGVAYLMATFDLGPGVDTTMELFWEKEADILPIATNDDAHAGRSFLSVLHWIAPVDGIMILRIAPRTGGLNPVVLEESGSTYHLAVALSGSALAEQLDERIRQQVNIPVETPITKPIDASPMSVAQAAPTIAPPPVIVTDARTGQAYVFSEKTTLYEEPSAESPVLQELPQDSLVTLFGHAHGGWVRVQPMDSVAPGWVWSSHLRPRDASAPGQDTPSPPNQSIAPILSGSTPVIRITRSDDTPLPVPEIPPPVPPITVTVHIIRAPGGVIPTPSVSHDLDTSALHAMVGERIQIVTAFGDMVSEAMTTENGSITLLIEGTPYAVYLRVPAFGITIPLNLSQPSVRIVLPEEDVL